MEPEKSIALLTCYFGKLPWYTDYFVHSCKYNPTIDFFIISDDSTFTSPLPDNVKLIYLTLDELNHLATQKLSFEVNIKEGYKLCDFKPAYGFIFSELLAGYDFWGHCDIDIIFGNIRNFITGEILTGHDLVSVRHDWLSGCFLIYKNNDKLNTLFRQSRDYRKVFSEDRHYCFDETNFSHDAFNKGISYDMISTEIESMTHVVKRLEAENYIKPFFDFLIIEGLPGKLRWENGEMFFKEKFEVLFYHMIYFKKLYNPKTKPGKIPDSFNISPTRIYQRPKLNTLHGAA
jgi:hypothetical protein